MSCSMRQDLPRLMKRMTQGQLPHLTRRGFGPARRDVGKSLTRSRTIDLTSFQMLLWSHMPLQTSWLKIFGLMDPFFVQAEMRMVPMKRTTG